MEGAKFFSSLFILVGFILIFIGGSNGYDALNSESNSGLFSSIQTAQGWFYIGAGIVSGLLMIGLGYIVGLLQGIFENTESNENKEKRRRKIENRSK
jgi:uncharacterized membrane protein